MYNYLSENCIQKKKEILQFYSQKYIFRKKNFKNYFWVKILSIFVDPLESEIFFLFGFILFLFLFLPFSRGSTWWSGAGFWGREGTQVGDSRGADWTGYDWLAEEDRNRRKTEEKRRKGKGGRRTFGQQRTSARGSAEREERKGMSSMNHWTHFIGTYSYSSFFWIVFTDFLVIRSVLWSPFGLWIHCG